MINPEMARTSLHAMQEEIAQHGFYSALWRDGDTWQFLASTDPHWLDMRRYDVAPPDAIVHWVPAADVKARERR